MGIRRRFRSWRCHEGRRIPRTVLRAHIRQEGRKAAPPAPSLAPVGPEPRPGRPRASPRSAPSLAPVGPEPRAVARLAAYPPKTFAALAAAVNRAGNSPKTSVPTPTTASPARNSRPGELGRGLLGRLAHVHVDDDPQVVEGRRGRVDHGQHRQGGRASRRPGSRPGSRTPWPRSRPAAECRSATAGRGPSAPPATGRAGPARRTC